MLKTLTYALLAAFISAPCGWSQPLGTRPSRAERGPSAILLAAPLEGGGVMLIGARNAMLARGGGLTAKSYVQDGLVAMWDGIENAGWGVHDPNATVWKDLVSGQYDCALKGATFGAMSLVSSSSGQVATASKYPYFNWQYPFSLEVLFKYTGGGACVLKIGYWQLWRQATGTYDFYPTSSSSSLTNNRANIDETKINTASFVYTNELKATYCNGVKQVGGRSDYWSTQILQFFGRNSNYTTGHIYCARYYSRALTAAEIAHNYAVDKARFNLPDAT